MSRNDESSQHGSRLSSAKQALWEKRLRQKNLGDGRPKGIARRPEQSRIPLSFAQQRLWFFDQLEPGSSVYNRPSHIRLTGALDVEALERSLTEIIRRHEVLRTTFVSVDGSPCQVIAPARPLSFPVVDLQHLPESERTAQAWQLVNEEARRPFDLAQGPHLRALLLRLGEQEHVLLLTIHHIVFDGWSMGVLLRELGTLYDAFTTGRASSLPELSIQYGDFAAWQRQWFQGKLLERQLAYWKQQLAGALSALGLPTDHPRPASRTYRGAGQSLVLSKGLTERLKALSREEGVTLFMTLLAGFQTLLSRYTGQEDIVVGAPTNGRLRVETEELIGCFINTLVLRTDLSGDPTFQELLDRVRQTALSAYAHQDLPFEKLVEELQPARNLSQTPFFQVMLNFRNIPKHAIEVQGLRIEDVETDNGVAIVDLFLDVVEKPEGLCCLFTYNLDLFDAGTMTRMLIHFQTLLEGITANPEQRISDLPLLSAAERHRLLVEWNQTKADYSTDQCIHELFETQVERTPERVAVEFEGERLAYGDLNRRANQLAHHLQKLGVGPEVLVGICLERSLELVVGLLGILKAGGAYVPLDPDYPKDRLAFMLEDTQAPVLLTQERLVCSLPQHRAKTVCLDADREITDNQSEENPASGATAGNLAYVIYTSGSTGSPKGVLVSHHNVTRLFAATDPWFHFDQEDVWTLFHSYSFDFSVWEMWGALIYGGRLVVVPGWMTRSPDSFYELLCQEQVTVLNQTPSAFYQLMRVEEESGPDRVGELALRLVIFGGEAIEVNRLRPWFERHGDERPRLVNMYGITETTVHVTSRPLKLADLSQEKGSPIGRPLPDLQLYLLDEHLQPVPIGVPGEIYVAGQGLSRGYLNRPELSAERFIPNPFSQEFGARLYKTGDLARYLSHGELVYLGRSDHQVKIRGYRIELGEIEAVLSQHPGIREVVAARQEGSGDQRLVAYVVVTPETAPATNEMRSFLKEKLPEYMVPASFVVLEALPLTPSGKVDRRALPAPEQARPDLESPFVAPRTPVEEELAEIWRGLLGLEGIGIRDNFFELGGHSLLLTLLAFRIQQAFHVQLPLRILFDAPTITDLSAAIAAAQVDQEDPAEVARILEELKQLSPDEVTALLEAERGLSVSEGEQ